jgi:phage shock protein A
MTSRGNRLIAIAGLMMDLQTAKDYIEDLLRERAQLYERIRQLEAERDQWQTKAVSHD